VVELTPPGSACSIAIMRNAERAGSVKGLHLVVSDIEAHRSTMSEFAQILVDPLDPEAIRRGLERALTETRAVDVDTVRNRYSWERAADQYDTLLGDAASTGHA